jgi:hypothetical protein
MSIFDIFTFKKEAERVFTKENFSLILKTMREEIIFRIKSVLKGSEKMELVNNVVIAKIREIRKTCKNGLVLWIIDQIIKIVPTITQIVYDFLKERVENL